jgi:hypothetical protein
MPRLATTLAALALALGCTATMAATSVTASVPGNINTTPLDLGSFAAGTYQLVGAGLVDLDGSGSFVIRPDGTPNAPVTVVGYESFNPSGTVIVEGNYGPAGTNAKIGALIGTLNPAAAMGNNPTALQQADWFQIGYGTVITLASAGHIYAAVNDTYPWNNTGDFRLTVTAVPEPGQWLLTLAGLSAIGLIVRRRRAV